MIRWVGSQFLSCYGALHCIESLVCDVISPPVHVGNFLGIIPQPGLDVVTDFAMKPFRFIRGLVRQFVSCPAIVDGTTEIYRQGHIGVVMECRGNGNRIQNTAIDELHALVRVRRKKQR